VRLLTVTHFYEAHGGGIEHVAAQLCRQFVSDGHHASWAASDADDPPTAIIEPIPLRCVNPTERLTGLPMPIPGPASVLKLARAIRNSDGIVIHDALYVTSILAMMLARLSGKPAILFQHIGCIPFRSAPMRMLMRVANQIVTRPMMAIADHVVFISEAVRNQLSGSNPTSHHHLIYNGVDGAIFHRSGAFDRRAILRSHGLPDNKMIALFVGRFVEKKGLAIIEVIARQRPDLHLVLAGGGPIRPQDWRLPNVHCLGRQTQASLSDLYRASDMLLLPSVGEGYPLVIQEALACGLPVICGLDSARADPEATGWLQGVEIDLINPETSARRCGAAIDSLSRANTDRAAMAAFAARSYSWSRMANAVVDYARQPNRAC
jgi:glycosyltransferase involved in cell wall biosynthesis